MALHDRSVRLTYDDYLLFSEDGRRHEIIDGEHWVSAAPFLKHQDVLLALATLPGQEVPGTCEGQRLPATSTLLRLPRNAERLVLALFGVLAREISV